MTDWDPMHTFAGFAAELQCCEIDEKGLPVRFTVISGHAPRVCGVCGAEYRIVYQVEQRRVQGLEDTPTIASDEATAPPVADLPPPGVQPRLDEDLPF